MHRIGSLLIVTGLALPYVGCGGGGPEVTKVSTAGDLLTPLPGDRGAFAVRYDTPSTRGARGKGRVATIVATFYQPDGTTPMTTAPTDVKVRFGAEPGSPTVDLAPSPGGAKPAEFTSKPGDYPQELRGVLLATINGEEVEAPFSVR